MAVPPGDEPNSRVESAALQLVYLLGLAAVAGGVYVLRNTDIGSDAGHALSAVATQLPVTIVPAIVIFALAAVNVVAGAVLVRALAGAPFSGYGQATLCGLAGAVLLDTALMATVGLVGLFTWPVLVFVNLAVLAAGRRLRPIVTPGRATALRLPAMGVIGWILVLVVWSGPLLLQLASPFVPSNDVPPNHVAPVEHLRAFGSLSALDVVVSPVYGTSRIFLGYQGFAGALSTMGNVPGGSAVASLILPLLILLAVASCALAGAIGGRRAQGWALLLVPLTVPFLRVGDARATVLAIPLAALALWLLIEPLGADQRRRAAVLTVVIGAAIYVHPLIGLFTAATAGLCWLLWPREFGPNGLAAAIAAPIIAVPQLAAMAGVSWAAVTALAALPLAAVVIVALTSERFVRPALGRQRLWLALVIGAALLATVALAILEPDMLSSVVAGAAAVLGDYAVLLAAGIIGVVLAVIAHRHGDRMTSGIRVLVAGMVAGLLAAALASILSLFVASDTGIGYEVPKGVTYFAPTLLAIIGSVGMAALWARRSIALPIRFVAASFVLILAAAPIRAGVVARLSLGEHRLAENLSITYGTTTNGYWLGFPDVRKLIDPVQEELIDALRREIAAGRLGTDSDVLHVAQTWRSDAAPSYTIPLSALAGVIETLAAPDVPRDTNTVGGRLYTLDQLDQLLGPQYKYVVTESRGLPIDVLERIVAAGYKPIFSNPVARLFVLQP